MAEQEGLSNTTPLQWSVIKSEDEFLQTHKVLRNKYGLLKTFQFRNPSQIGGNLLHLTNTVKPRREKKDEYLSAILSLDPIPDEVIAFLCLDNASYFTTTADGATVLEGSGSVAHVDHSTETSPRTTASIVTPLPSAVAVPMYSNSTSNSNIGSASSSGSSSATKAQKQWWLNAGLLLSFAVVVLSAWFVSSLMASVGRATGISNERSIGTLNCFLYYAWLIYVRLR